MNRATRRQMKYRPKTISDEEVDLEVLGSIQRLQEAGWLDTNLRPQIALSDVEASKPRKGELSQKQIKESIERLGPMIFPKTGSAGPGKR